MEMIVGVDSSTQSTKVEVRELASGRLVSVGRASHPATTPPRSEQDPESWWQALLGALSQAEEHLQDVAAISVAGQQHGLVVLDENGRALRSAKLWNDTESAPEAAVLTDALGAGGWAGACGSVPTASFTITKLAWLAANEPELMPRIASIMLPHDYLTWRLSGAHVTDRGDASGTGWWSPDSGDYDERLLDLVDTDQTLLPLLPKVLAPTEAAGSVTAADVLAAGLPANAIVGPGTGDNMAGALGLGLGPSDVAISIGTSGTVYGVSTTSTHDPKGEVAGFADGTGNYLPLVCTLNATKVTDSMARLLGLDPGALSSLALEAEAGSDGVVVVPYFDGERTPNLPNATGSVVGMRSDVGREQVARAAYEGVACGLLDGLDALVGAGVATDGRLFLIGGGAKAAAYRRAIADLAGRAVTVPKNDETVATGACVQAAATLSRQPPSEIAEAWGLGTGDLVEPEEVPAAEIRARYGEHASRADLG